MLSSVLDAQNGMNVYYLIKSVAQQELEVEMGRKIELSKIENKIEQLRNALNHLVEQEEACLFNDKVVQASVNLDLILNIYANFKKENSCI